jgi:hypothetical protein
MLLRALKVHHSVGTSIVFPQRPGEFQSDKRGRIVLHLSMKSHNPGPELRLTYERNKKATREKKKKQETF